MGRLPSFFLLHFRVVNQLHTHFFFKVCSLQNLMNTFFLFLRCELVDFFSKCLFNQTKLNTSSFIKTERNSFNFVWEFEFSSSWLKKCMKIFITSLYNIFTWGLRTQSLKVSLSLLKHKRKQNLDNAFTFYKLWRFL